HFGSLTRFLNATDQDLTQVEEVGPTVTEKIREFLDEAKNRNEIERLLKKGVHPKWEVAKGGHEGELKGKTFVITGTLPSLSRDEASQLIRQNGGKVTSSVSKQTDYLVVGEEAGSKLDKARSLGIKLLDEAALKKLIKKPS
ncbi:MAG: BRCT domain-containing protein, partial [Pseudomonadota bacterium]